MRRLIFLFILLLVSWHQTFAKTPPPPYCEGHPKKIISINSVSAVQTELDRYTAPECDHNGRYELCLQITESDSVLVFDRPDKVLTLTNTSPCEVVVGFLNARRSDGSTTPIIQVHGSKVTIFQPTFSNVKKAITFDGNNHKLVGGTINGISNQSDSLCVDGIGNNITVQDTIIDDCANAVRLNGDGNRISGASISFSYASIMPRAINYNLDDLTQREQFVQDFTRWQEENLMASGTCLDLNGQKATLQNVTIDICNGISAKLTGSGIVTNSQIIGEPIPDDSNANIHSGLVRHSTNCFLLQSASNVTLEGNTFSQCQTGVHVADANKIFIGPARFEDFAAKKNDIHHNDYAIHVERSQTVYDRHNSVHENLINPHTNEDIYNFGWWLTDSNTSVSAPKFEPADGHQVTEAEKEYPVVKYDGAGNAFVDVKVPLQTGKVELNFSRIDFGDWERYQSSVPFSDCAFSSAPLESDGLAKIRCPIQVTNEIKGKRLLAILHGNPVGSSQYAKALGVINDPTGIPVSGSAPTTGNMSGGATAVQSSAETLAVAGANPANNAGPGGAGGCGGSIVGQKTADEKTMKGYFVLWYIVLTSLFVFRFLRRNPWTK